MTVDEKVYELLVVGPLTVELVVGRQSDGLWVAIKLGDDQRFAGHSFSEAVELALTVRQRQEAEAQS
jgi:hypothetical protein